MDSRLKGTVIALATLLILAVLTIVGVANADALKKKYEKYNSTSATQVVSVDASVKNDDLMLGNSPYAWQNDDNFFDSDEKSHVAQMMEDMMTLHLGVLSVSRDIRILIQNYSGHIERGTEFEVNITPENGRAYTLKDSNKDGILTSAGLDPGKYTVTLLQHEDYIMPEESYVIDVKDKVDYTIIENDFLQTIPENETIRNLEDKMVASEEVKVKKQTNTGIPKDNTYKVGIDVSSANGDIEWDEVYDAGIRFAMIRAGYRGIESANIIIDENFDKNARLAARAGVQVGIYFYSQARSEAEAVEEASAVCNLLDNLLISYPLVIRMDASDGVSRTDDLVAEKRTDIAVAFCETVKNAGFKPMVYASEAWLNTNLEPSRLEKYGIWLAEYANSPSEKDYYYDLWQYTSMGKVSGIEGEVSLNLSYME